MMLHESDCSWTVLASVRGAIYIESRAGDILWIAATSSALHPRAILLPLMPDKLPAAGTECFARDDCLCVGEDLAIGLRDAGIWRPELRVREVGSALAAVRQITTGIDQATLRSPPRGLLANAMFPDALTNGGSSGCSMSRELVDRAYRTVESLCQISVGLDLQERLRDAIDLVGLGQGLTPSGDDLLGGFLYTLHALDSVYWGLSGVDWEVADAWLQQACPLTNKISFAILADHVHGDAAGPLHELLTAALDARFVGSLDPLVFQVAGIGHSSGWDMLVGVHCACSAVARMMLGALEAG